MGSHSQCCVRVGKYTVLGSTEEACGGWTEKLSQSGPLCRFAQEVCDFSTESLASRETAFLLDKLGR